MDAKYIYLVNTHSVPCSNTTVFPANCYFTVPLRNGLDLTRHCLGGIKTCVWGEHLAVIVRYEDDGFSCKVFLRCLFLITPHTSGLCNLPCRLVCLFTRGKLTGIIQEGCSWCKDLSSGYPKFFLNRLFSTSGDGICCAFRLRGRVNKDSVKSAPPFTVKSWLYRCAQNSLRFGEAPKLNVS